MDFLCLFLFIHSFIIKDSREIVLLSCRIEVLNILDASDVDIEEEKKKTCAELENWSAHTLAKQRDTRKIEKKYTYSHDTALDVHIFPFCL